MSQRWSWLWKICYGDFFCRLAYLNYHNGCTKQHPTKVDTNNLRLNTLFLVYNPLLVWCVEFEACQGGGALRLRCVGDGAVQRCVKVEVCWVGGLMEMKVEVCQGWCVCGWRCVEVSEGGGVSRLRCMRVEVTQTLCISLGGLQGRRVADEEHGPTEWQRSHSAPPVHWQVCLWALERRWGPLHLNTLHTVIIQRLTSS